MGDTEIAKVVGGSLKCIENEHASNAIVRLAKENPGLNLICIAPLTNLAVALKLEPNLP
jgi:inosine-uridine nucleoside N-ribohydrolase